MPKGNPNPKRENLKVQPTKWKHLPTKAVRIPELFEQQILELARSLDIGKLQPRREEYDTAESLYETLRHLSLTDLLKIQLELPLIIEQRKDETRDRSLETAILFLAERCDGARDMDGQGFNKIDVRFGKWLAARIVSKQSLIKSHAESALKMLTKYKGQLERGGIALPAWEEIEHQYPETHRTPRVPDEELPTQRIELKGERVAVYAPYDSTGQFQRKAKSIEGYAFSSSDKGWYYPVERVEEVLATFNDGYEIDPNLEGARALIKQQQSEELAAKEKEALEASSEIIRLIHAADLDAPLANGWHLRDYQKRGAEWLLAHRQGGIYRGGILADDMGLGKAQPLDSKVLTPTGWKFMGDILPGDAVVNSQGSTSYVTGVYPQGEKDIYRVVFTDGSSTECCDEHLWAVQSPFRKKYQASFKILALSQIRNDLREKSGNLKHYIPIVKPIEFQEQFVNINPYLLGVLLGDGHLSNNCISFATADEFILNEVNRLTRVFGVVAKVGSGCNYRISRLDPTWSKNYLLGELRELELAGKNSYTKFIPDCYKFNTVTNRIALLQGLMDTDGSVSNNVVEYSSSSYSLAKDVQFLVQSLGGKCTFKSRIPFYMHGGERKPGQISYRLIICLPPGIIPFRLPRKAEKYNHRQKYLPCRGIKEVHYIGKKEAQCISVDASDHLYITDDCVVTHNTMTALVASRAMQKTFDCPIFVIAPVSVLDNWMREAERAEVRIECHSWAKLPTPLETSKYVLIADEAHMMQSGEQTKRGREALELAKHENCLAAWMLSGTPIKNGRPINLYPLLDAVGHPIAADRWAYQKYFCAAHHKTMGKKSFWDTTGAAHLDELAKKTEDVILRRTKQECLTELPPKTRLYKEAELEPKAATAYSKEVQRLVEDYRQRAKEGKVDADAEALVTLNYLRKVGSEAKVQSALLLAKELLEQGQQIVLFTEFVESAKAIHEALGGELLTGESKDRQAMIDRFQSGESKIFVGTIKAGGVGITLTSASNVILVDRPWTSADALQAEDRCWRLGQQNAVFATWLQLGDIDKAIDSLLLSKQERIELVLKGKRKTLRGLDSPKDLARELLAIL